MGCGGAQTGIKRDVPESKKHKILEFIKEVGLEAIINVLTHMAEPAKGSQIGPLGNLFFRPLEFHGVGSEIEGHLHNFDHVTYVTEGAVSAEVDGSITIYSAPAIIFVDKNKVHRFVALTDHAHAVCIFAARDEDGNVVDAWNDNFFATQAKIPQNHGIGRK